MVNIKLSWIYPMSNNLTAINEKTLISWCNLGKRETFIDASDR